MKHTLVYLLFLAFPLLSYAQDFKEIKDQKHACAYLNSETRNAVQLAVFHIVETMPEPILSYNSIENLLNQKVKLSDSKIEKITFQTLINCEGKAGDYQFLACGREDPSVCSQVLEVFQNDVNWQPGQQRNRAVDVLIRIEVRLENGQFKVKRL